MRVRIASLAATLVLVLPFTVNAQTTAPPTPDFAPMTYLVGVWHCTYLKDPNPKLVGTTYSIEGATSKNGYWEILDVPNGEIHIARDAAAHRWTFIYLGNGGDYSIMTTPGWDGKTMTLKEVFVYGNAPEGTATFSRQSDMQYTINYSAHGSAGVEAYSARCTRI